MINIENKELNSYKSNLKRIRVASGLTQYELASLSGVNIKSISAYEQSTDKINKASVDTLFYIAEALNCSIEDIMQKEYL